MLSKTKAMLLSDSLKKNLLTEIKFSASRSSGPGGQNINKVSTKAELRFSVVDSKFLNEKQKKRILIKLKNRITNSGDLILSSRSERTQRGNRQQTIHKFFNLLDKALIRPKRRIPTKPSKASNLKRLEQKEIHSQKKQLRKPPGMLNNKI